MSSKWGVKIASEKCQRALAKTWTAESIEAEEAIFSFPVTNGGEEIRPAPCVFMPSLVDTVVSLLDSHDRFIC